MRADELAYPTRDVSVTSIWSSLAHLTKPSLADITHENGSTFRAVVPPLWEQAMDALHSAYRKAEGGGATPLAERSLVDADLLEATSMIRDSVRVALIKYGYCFIGRDGRTLDFHVWEFERLATLIVNEGMDLDWWEYQYGSWVRWLRNYLKVEHKVKAVRLRNSPCPRCGTSQVTADSDGGPVVVPAILIQFHKELVQAAQCLACNAIWWRGDDLHRLASLLHVTPG
jgi:hypothetical protein